MWFMLCSKKTREEIASITPKQRLKYCEFRGILDRVVGSHGTVYVRGLNPVSHNAIKDHILHLFIKEEPDQLEAFYQTMRRRMISQYRQHEREQAHRRQSQMARLRRP